MLPKVNNAHTKLQIKTWLANAVKKAQNPDPREKLKRLRKEKMNKIIKNYGF